MASSDQAKTYDVIVVGAGLSGLQSAHTLLTSSATKTPPSVLILEARDRVGGKTLTHTLPTSTQGHPKLRIEYGAAWISTSQERMYALAKQLNLTLLQQNVTGDVVCEDFGGELRRFKYGDVPVYPAEDGGQGDEGKDCIRIRDLVEKISTSERLWSDQEERRRLDSMSFETWLWENHAGKRARATAQVWTHAMLGVDPGEISALYYFEYCSCGGGLMTMRSDGKGGGQELRVKEGTLAFSAGLKGMVEQRGGEVRTGAAVVGIEDRGGEVRVRIRTVGGNKREEVIGARRVVVSVPTPVYKTIEFSPKLDEWRSVVDRTRYGYYVKYHMQFQRPFWRENGLCGLVQSFTGPISVFRDVSYDEEGIWVLLGFVGGQFGRKWSKGDDKTKRKQVVDQIQKIFGGDIDVHGLVLDAVESPWMGEEWSGWGCPCPHLPPGLLAEGGIEVLRRPQGNVHFVGTELGSNWRGYMEAAVREGERGALEVLQSLKDEKRKL